MTQKKKKKLPLLHWIVINNIHPASCFFIVSIYNYQKNKAIDRILIQLATTIEATKIVNQAASYNCPTRKTVNKKITLAIT